MRLALLLPIWLVFAVGEPSLVHSCPMHGGAIPQAPSDGHVGHSPTDAQQQAPHSDHTCSCIGGCTMAGAATVPIASTVAVAAVSLREPPAIETQVRVARLDEAHLLPYSNGPPTQRV